ncbi:MAG: GNAT family N-acetyltransferase [Nocardioides sp.]|uniref:GNAT family N-acetyltransferase n=1 Tax=Nocardioides sp. TaxID=35761 RepID=UPI0039E3A442
MSDDSASRTIRVATAADAAACAAIYAPYVAHTPITFETEVPGVEEMTRRIAQAQERHVWLVLEEDGVVTGYAYGGSFKSRAAYDWAVEGSVYLDESSRGGGRGRALYAELIERLAALGYRRFIGVIALPNEASLRLHRSFGFADVGTLHRVGWKHGAWHDVAYLELDLADPEGDGDPASPPRALGRPRGRALG